MRQWYIADMGSRLGTFVNEQPISQALGHPLRHGDVIRIGNKFLRYLQVRQIPPGKGQLN